jgi:two-component system, chemotaxis family, response regulator WspR
MRTVAIVDDMLPNALLLKGYMKQIEGIEAVTFTDPTDALARCTEHAPDLVLLDYHMPQMNGVEFLGKFRAIAHLKDIPIVMITGEESKDALYKALEAGANDFLRKPVDDIELVTRARNLLELRAKQIDLAAANQQLYFLATTDQLTNLKNRRYFIEQLELEVERSCRYGRQCAVAILDADKFKSINDTYGHDIGDKVLQALSQMLLDELRNVDLVGRIGGEEFAILFPETGKEAALDVCQRLLVRIRGARVTAEAKEINFTVSMGISEVVLAGDEADAVLKRADQALYRAKQGGRDRCEVA